MLLESECDKDTANDACFSIWQENRDLKARTTEEKKVFLHLV